MNRANGFTLVELLVALTVSAFLLASLSWVVSTLGGQLRASDGDDAGAEVAAMRPILTTLIEGARHDAKEQVEVTATRLSLVTSPPRAMGPVGPVRLVLSVVGRRGARKLEGVLTPLDAARAAPRTFALAFPWDDIVIAQGETTQESAPIEVRFKSKDTGMAIVATPKANAAVDCVFDPISMACR